MKTYLTSFFSAAIGLAAAHSDLAAAEARVDSWFTTESTHYARVRETDAAAAAGSTTWTGQTLPAYAGVQEVASDNNYVYVRSYGLAGYVMGPWYLNALRTQLFPNRPVAAIRVRRFTKNPAPAASKSLTGLGTIGFYVNGVAIFDNRDGFAWNGTAESGNGQGYWQRDAYVNEGVTFDAGGAHQEMTGNYHYHAQPPLLRLQLGDNISYNPQNGTFAEATNQLRHSPILAWVADGFPIYGPYGYANATNPASGVRRMVSGYVPRDGQNGTDNLPLTGRTTIPAWAQRAYGVGPNQAGPAISTTYPFGRYLEDKAYLGDLTNAATAQRYQLGNDFDLNEWNCRWCVTPEFPGGVWAYFCTITASGQPAFPYAIGRQYFGTPDNTALTAIPTSGVTTHFRGGPDEGEKLNTPAVAGGEVVLTWSALEGGTYRLEQSDAPASSNWFTLQTNLLATSTVGRALEPFSSGTNRFFRIGRTSIAPYFGGGTTTTNTASGDVTASPNNAARSTANQVVTFTINATAPPLPPANVVPSSVTIGSITANPGSITRPASTSVTATFSFPAGATTGAQTVIITFPGPNGAAGPSYTQAGAFTIN